MGWAGLMRDRSTPGIGHNSGPEFEPVWPLTALNALRIHPEMEWGGTAGNVEWIKFDNGLIMAATGTGSPITKDAEGFHFWQGQYLSYRPAAITEFSAVAAFAQVTLFAIPADGVGGLTQAQMGDKQQKPINLSSRTENLLSMRKRHSDLMSDTGSNNIRVGWVNTEIGRMHEEMTFNIGIEVETNLELIPDYGATAVWLNNRAIRAERTSETLEPSEWQVGRDMYGTLHEGVVLTRPLGIEGPLYPPGVTPRWICDQLKAF